MIEVILREDIKTLGRAGEMVRVKPGYARNYLLPQGLAYEATEGNKKRIAAETRVRAARNQSERDQAEREAATLRDVTVSLTSKAGEEGKLFGSITSQDIAEALAGQGHTVDRRRIELEHPIKTTGVHSVTVRLHPEVHAELRVSVAPE
ncbi:MAG TPA: 50S ribosomal protein L9 [Gemmatimonadales bacterium]|jgi:large subunit ribosomal protein L9|nr:50S ribosomal protein L9 [Gemmatimonadales bacterium]